MSHQGQGSYSSSASFTPLFPLVVETQKQPEPLVFTQKRPSQMVHEKDRNVWCVKPLRLGVCLLWQLALIILTNALPFNESSLSGQPSEAGGPPDPPWPLTTPQLEFMSG